MIFAFALHNAMSIGGLPQSLLPFLGPFGSHKHDAQQAKTDKRRANPEQHGRLGGDGATAAPAARHWEMLNAAPAQQQAQAHEKQARPEQEQVFMKQQTPQPR
ncbi:hypothetical protein [Hymenobacter properus]|uniref:Uncharacterized protein n=1 Tax=Hymenobacter properus TaxID=2791026 RepID=A0A931BL61_9BACT|nr:hypothetical protein [Hymenobacter properus]MBF9142263.1 hypothetical protein [Hymenobacter properus]MBR7721070.1 hypothetical protein [Microvirga sp. SRT04]